jgi:hypothetical protein
MNWNGVMFSNHSMGRVLTHGWLAPKLLSKGPYIIEEYHYY